MPTENRALRATSRGALLALLIAAGPPLHAADGGGPYSAGIAQDLTRHSNLLRLPEGALAGSGLSREDTVSTTSLRAGVDETVGSQRVFGDLGLSALRYANNGRYDHEGYTLGAGLDWATLERLSGTLRAAAIRRLASFGADELGLPTEKNLETARSADALFRVGTVTALTGEAALGWRSVDYSSAAYRSREFQQRTASLGLRWRPRAATTLGVALRRSDGVYPNFGTPGSATDEDRFTRDDVDLSVLFVPSAASRLSARVSLGRTEYELATQRDFSGVTGDLRWDWQPRAKLRLQTRLTRDPGQDSYPFGDVPAGDALGGDTIEYSRITTALRLSADYELTYKVMLNLTLLGSRRTLARTLPDTDAELAGRDRSTLLAFGATWTPRRSIEVGCKLSREQRRGTPPLSSSFGDTAVGCRVALLLN